MKNRFNPQVKLALHPQFADFIRKEKDKFFIKSIYPINIEVSPTQVCNATCDWCFYAGTHLKMNKDSLLDSAIFYQMLEGMVDMGTKALTWTGGGEPTLHPNFPTMVAVTRDMGIKQGLFTNGLLKPKYDPSLFDWIRVSNTDRKWNLEALTEIRGRTKVLGMAVNYVGDDRVVEEALEVGNKVGVDYVQVRQALNLRGLVTQREPPKIDDKRLMITTYKFDDSSNPHGYKDCYGFNFVPFVWHNGNVDVCGYHPNKGSPYTLGNLKEKGLRQIFDEAPRSVPVIDSCQVCCKNHEINKLINVGLQIKDGDFV